MLTDAELDERERRIQSYDDTLRQLQYRPGDKYLTNLRHRQEGTLALIAGTLLTELRSARATIAEMRGRLERALGSVDAALGDERLLALTTSGVASEGVQNESAVIPVTSENDGLGPNHVDARKET